MVLRVIQIFLSTPSDVAAEREALKALVSEINDVVAFLAPEREMRLQLIHYETDTFPDVGAPHRVIDKQMSNDYDIYFGVMWKRCGTPTTDEDSGTIHEFNQALARRQKSGRPVIMFYFGMDEIGMPTTIEEIEQLAKVVKFRQRLQSIGLTASYPTKAEFRERARVGLLRAVADILTEPVREPELEGVTEDMPIALERLCRTYDEVRETMQSGPARSRRMSAIVEEMKTHVAVAQTALQTLKTNASAGHRLAAIAVLQLFPSRTELSWLADRLNPKTEKPFMGYQAGVALLQAVRSLPQSDCDILRKQIDRALELARGNPEDQPRIKVLEYAAEEASKKCA
ncbi:hypothetical protein [Sinorhizobium meliloti]|uniref:hypothetical protein n=1 Tax=Rhizobium meliloti TaxID=382 RepID=UPI000FDC3F61|nr:hypothetical protein [Sinorhizobium meliloti]RVL56354.1 hypothetical protein CN137_28340 [Sinorhizobium meliloti]